MPKLIINGLDVSSGNIADSELNKTSINPVQNNVVATALEKKADKTEIPIVDSELNDESENAIQNKAVAETFGKCVKVLGYLDSGSIKDIALSSNAEGVTAFATPNVTDMPEDGKYWFVYINGGYSGALHRAITAIHLGSGVTYHRTYNGGTQNWSDWQKSSDGGIASTVNTQYSAASSTANTIMYPTCVDSNNSTAAGEALKTNSAIRYQLKAGTTSTDGYAQLMLGNATLAGADNNMRGEIVFYNNANTYYAQLRQNTNQTNNAAFALPATGGTLALDLNKAKLTENNEGGNLRLTSPDGTLYMEQDCYNNTTYRCYVVKDGVTKAVWYFDSVNNLITFYPNIASMTLTGNLTFKTANYSSNAFKVTDSGTAYGQLVQVGADGDTIVGAGESVKNLPTAANITGASENLHLCADGSVYIYSNCNTIANRKTFTFNTAGAFIVPTGIGADTSCVRNISAGTEAATTSNCPSGALYGQYS